MADVSKKYEATFPNIEMNTVPHLKLVQLIIVFSLRTLAIPKNASDCSRFGVSSFYGLCMLLDGCTIRRTARQQALL